MKKTWSNKELSLLQKYYSIMNASELKQLLPDKTGTAIRSKAKVLHLLKENKRFHFSEQDINTLITLYPNTLSADIAKLLGCTLKCIYQKAQALKLKKDPAFIVEQGKLSIQKAGIASLSARYRKGHAPANKGKKMDPDLYARVKHTFFKKGHTPANHKPIGYERITRDGYLEVKTAEPNVFEQKHRLIYKEHYGEIPEECVVRFKNGNKLDLSPENLFLMSKSENMAENTIHRYPTEVKRAIRTINKLTRKINEYETNKH